MPTHSVSAKRTIDEISFLPPFGNLFQFISMSITVSSFWLSVSFNIVTKTAAYFRIQKNALTGTIPSELGDMPLTELWLQRNFGLTGTLPLGLSKLSNSLTDIRLGMTAIGGTLPEFLFEMSQVWRMDFSDARFTGTLSTNFGKLGSLQSLRLTGNQLSGTIPTEMGLMTSLYELSLFGNNISGTIPPAVCALRLEQRLEFLSMNCLPESDSAPSVVCDCCSICCNSSGSQCVFP